MVETPCLDSKIVCGAASFRGTGIWNRIQETEYLVQDPNSHRDSIVTKYFVNDLILLSIFIFCRIVLAITYQDLDFVHLLFTSENFKNLPYWDVIKI